MIVRIHAVKRLAAIVVAIQAILWPACAIADAASAWIDGPKADIRLVSAATAVGDMDSIPLGVEVRLDKGWKTYWRSPGDAGIPPQVAWDGSANLSGTEFFWPAPVRFHYFDLETFGYKDRVVFPVEARVASVGEAVSLRAQVDLLVCDDVCIPHSYEAVLDLPSGPAMPSDFANLIDQYRNQVPGDGSRAGLMFEGAEVSGAPAKPLIRAAFRADAPFQSPDLLIEGHEDAVFSNPEFEYRDGGRLVMASITAEDIFGEGKPVDLQSAPLTLTLIDGPRNIEASTTPKPDGLAGVDLGGPELVTLLSVMALALVGGLILNLMPCVLPVISIKLLSVVGHGGGDPKQVRLGFLATTAGIIVSFLALASLTVGVKSAGLAVGWGIQFQHPLFVVALVVVLTLFAANMWGLFEVRLPGRVTDAAVAAGHGNSLAGQFFQGAFATVLATPCTAPFLGTSIGFALSRGPFEIYAIFAALGVGMALPFILVALFPALATKLPKSGPWMNALKKVLALVLLATAVWLLSVMAAQVSLAAALVVAALMAAIFAMFALRARKPVNERGAGLASAVAVAVLLAFLAPSALPALGLGGRDVASIATRDANWQPFDRAAIPALVAEGKVVFVDVSADWCITCQVNKKRVVDTDDVTAAFERGDVVLMRADWTRPDEEIARYLASFGRFGIPFNVIYGPDAPQGVVLPELLSADAVTGGLAQAGVTAAVAVR
ncbi:MAG: protein-disulfide reductase DsbD domain-containing protein [Alphaproteobacteria bacterium]